MTPTYYAPLILMLLCFLLLKQADGFMVWLWGIAFGLWLVTTIITLVGDMQKAMKNKP